MTREELFALDTIMRALGRLDAAGVGAAASLADELAALVDRLNLVGLLDLTDDQPRPQQNMKRP